MVCVIQVATKSVSSPSGMLLPLSFLLLSFSHSGLYPPFFSPKHLCLDSGPHSPLHSAMYLGCGQVRLPHTTLPSGDTLLQNFQSALISRAQNILLLFCLVQHQHVAFMTFKTQLPLLFAPRLSGQTAFLWFRRQTQLTPAPGLCLRLSVCVESLLYFHHTFPSHLFTL